MSCETIQEALVDYYYDDLPPEERRATAQHLGTCTRCALEYCRLDADLSGIGELLYESPPEALKEELDQKVEAAFRAPWWIRAVRWIRAPVPAYQAALALASVSAMILMLDRPILRPLPAPSPLPGVRTVPAPPRPTPPPGPVSTKTAIEDYDTSTLLAHDPSIL